MRSVPPGRAFVLQAGSLAALPQFTVEPDVKTHRLRAREAAVDGTARQRTPIGYYPQITVQAVFAARGTRGDTDAAVIREWSVAAGAELGRRRIGHVSAFDLFSINARKRRTAERARGARALRPTIQALTTQQANARALMARDRIAKTPDRASPRRRAKARRAPLPERARQRHRSGGSAAARAGRSG